MINLRCGDKTINFNNYKLYYYVAQKQMLMEVLLSKA